MKAYGMTGISSNSQSVLTGDPLNDLLDDTNMRRAGSKLRPRNTSAGGSRGTGVMGVATVASLIWIASVLSFSWARFALPDNPLSVVEAAQARIGLSDWLLIIAAILGPLLLIWVIAWLIRRSMELKDESRRLARAAILLADVAEKSERRAEAYLQLPDKAEGDVITGGSGHLHREIERASNTMHALQTQMVSMEVALARQSSMFDNAADRIRELGITEPDNVPQSGNIVPVRHTEISAPALTTGSEAKDAAIVDMSLDIEDPVTKARRDLSDAQGATTWNKLVPDQSAQDEALDDLRTMRDDIQAIKAPVMVKADTIDPFDDLGSPQELKVSAATVETGTGKGIPVLKPLEPEVDAPRLVPEYNDRAIIEETSEGDLAFAQRSMDWQKFVKAANFPEHEQDKETLDALYDVLTDPEAAALLQSSEDTLATLADLDLYMEDFVPQKSPVSSWREHSNGSGTIQPIEAPLEQSRITAKLNADAAFQKLSERFVRRYHSVLKRLFNECADEELAVKLADSRTGRAYILMSGALGRL